MNTETRLSEWDIIEAVSTAHLVKGRVEIIRKFAEMIKQRVPEKPDMQDYVRDHPWLIEPNRTMLAHERSLDKLICDEFELEPSSEPEGARRLDFFCLGDRFQTAYVVEVKRPGDLVGRKEFDQLRDYVLFLRRRLQDECTDPAHKRAVIRGLLVADRTRPGDEGHGKTYKDADLFDIRKCNHLLTTAETMHEEFLNVVKLRAPMDDPRMQDLAASAPSVKKTSSGKGRGPKGSRKKARKKK
jgi:hypothetical protein